MFPAHAPAVRRGLAVDSVRNRSSKSNGHPGSAHCQRDISRRQRVDKKSHPCLLARQRSSFTTNQFNQLSLLISHMLCTPCTHSLPRQPPATHSLAPGGAVASPGCDMPQFEAPLQDTIAPHPRSGADWWSMFVGCLNVFCRLRESLPRQVRAVPRAVWFRCGEVWRGRLVLEGGNGILAPEVQLQRGRSRACPGPASRPLRPEFPMGL